MRQTTAFGLLLLLLHVKWNCVVFESLGIMVTLCNFDMFDREMIVFTNTQRDLVFLWIELHSNNCVDMRIMILQCSVTLQHLLIISTVFICFKNNFFFFVIISRIWIANCTWNQTIWLYTPSSFPFPLATPWFCFFFCYYFLSIHECISNFDTLIIMN